MDRWRRAGAGVHLQSTHSVAVSCLADVDPNDVLPPLTAYYIMRVGSLPLVPYFPPGAEALGDAVSRVAGRHHAVLLANHGPVVHGRDLLAAGNANAELEEAGDLHQLLSGANVRLLKHAQREENEERGAE